MERQGSSIKRLVDDFQGSLLERIVHRGGRVKVVGTPHAAYPTLVREFFANFNTEIDAPESSHVNQTKRIWDWWPDSYTVEVM